MRFKNLPSLIVSKNGTSGVDAVSGATYSSHAIFNAVNDALSKGEEKIVLLRNEKAGNNNGEEGRDNN